jgi:hypothetical protein
VLCITEERAGVKILLSVYNFIVISLNLSSMYKSNMLLVLKDQMICIYLCNKLMIIVPRSPNCAPIVVADDCVLLVTGEP